MNEIKFVKKMKNGVFAKTVVVYNDDLNRYSGEDLLMESSRSQANIFSDSEIDLRVATIKQNIVHIHKTSNGERDSECFAHLLRMINEYGLLWYKIFRESEKENIISHGQYNSISGFNINAKSLAEVYAPIIFANDDFSEEEIDENRSFLWKNFNEAFAKGLENVKIDFMNNLNASKLSGFKR